MMFKTPQFKETCKSVLQGDFPFIWGHKYLPMWCAQASGPEGDKLRKL